jgi:hypothetical protein
VELLSFIPRVIEVQNVKCFLHVYLLKSLPTIAVGGYSRTGSQVSARRTIRTPPLPNSNIYHVDVILGMVCLCSGLCLSWCVLCRYGQSSISPVGWLAAQFQRSST